MDDAAAADDDDDDDDCAAAIGTLPTAQNATTPPLHPTMCLLSFSPRR